MCGGWGVRFLDSVWGFLSVMTFVRLVKYMVAIHALFFNFSFAHSTLTSNEKSLEYPSVVRSWPN